MARTKASVGAKISIGKSSKARCYVVSTASSGGSGSSGSSSRPSTSGGNPVCQRETPKWQRPITNFFIEKEPQRADDEGAGTSTEPQQENKRKSKRNVIESDDESDDCTKEITENDGKSNNDVYPNDVTNENDAKTDVEIPKNQELDESIYLEQLDGERSHKIEEYYINTGNGKGKGIGKKTKTDKENLDANRRDSLKRDLDEIASDDEREQITNKKVKLK